jgi:hypothetical protein
MPRLGSEFGRIEVSFPGPACDGSDICNQPFWYGLPLVSDYCCVNATRRYLCEPSNTRYLPIGLLEHLPGRLNDRAPLQPERFK